MEFLLRQFSGVHIQNEWVARSVMSWVLRYRLAAWGRRERRVFLIVVKRDSDAANFAVKMGKSAHAGLGGLGWVYGSAESAGVG
jgi:hypothetical protein